MTLADIQTVRVPVPYPVKATNCYLARARDGRWDIIDTGAHTPEAVAVWEDALGRLGIGAGGVRNIYITHYHPDHIGLAGWMQQHVGGEVYLHRVEAAWVPEVWQDGMPQARRVADQFRRHGMTEDWAAAIEAQFADQYHDVIPLPRPLHTVEDGQAVPFGEGELTVVWTPGHSDGHICLFSRELATVFTGDHILTHITPNVGLWPLCEPDPLDQFLASLRKVEALAPEHYLPAHGRSFERAEGRIPELLAHHQERLSLIAETAGEGHTAFDICVSVFGTKLSAHQMRFAMAETLSHLRRLQQEGRVAEEEVDGVVRYRQIQTATQGKEGR